MHFAPALISTTRDSSRPNLFYPTVSVNTSDVLGRSLGRSLGGHGHRNFNEVQQLIQVVAK